MKPRKAWAIIHSGNQLDCFDAHLPIYWLKSVARTKLKERSASDSKVVCVIVREVLRRKKSGKLLGSGK